jgi:hypothetical protein
MNASAWTKRLRRILPLTGALVACAGISWATVEIGVAGAQTPSLSKGRRSHLLQAQAQPVQGPRVGEKRLPLQAGEPATDPHDHHPTDDHHPAAPAARHDLSAFASRVGHRHDHAERLQSRSNGPRQRLELERPLGWRARLRKRQQDHAAHHRRRPRPYGFGSVTGQHLLSGDHRARRGQLSGRTL